MTDGTAGLFLKAAGGGSDPAYAAVAFTDLEAGQHTLAQEPRGTAGQFIKGAGVGSDPIYAALTSADWTGRVTAAQLLDGTNGYFLKAAGAGSSPDYAALAIGDLPTVTPAKGGTGQTTVPTKGDLLVGGSNILNLLGVGADNTVLTADAAAAFGVRWATSAAAGGVRSEANYIVFKSGATYYAQNGDTGVLDFSNASFVNLIASCFGATAGATIKLRPGTYDCGAGLPLYSGDASGPCYGGRISGSGRYATVLQASAPAVQGVVDMRAKYFTLDNLCIDGNNQATTSGLGLGVVPLDGYSATCFIGMNLIIKNTSQDGIRFRDLHFYESIINCRIYDGIVGYGVHFYEQANQGSNGADNGQLLFANTEIDGGLGSLHRTVAASGIIHRIHWDRCMFSGGYNGTYMLDCTGIGEQVFSACDLECGSAFDGQTIIKLDGTSVVFNGGVLQANSAGVTAVDAASGYVSGNMGYAYVFNGFKFGFTNTTAGDLTSWVSKSRYPILFNNCALLTAKTAAGESYAFIDYYPLVGSVWNQPDMISRPRPKLTEHFNGCALDTFKWGTSGPNGTVGMVAGTAGGAALLSTTAEANSTVLLNAGSIFTWSPAKFPKLMFDITLNSTANTDAVGQFGLRYDANNYIAARLYKPAASLYWGYDVCNASTHTSGYQYPANTNHWYGCVEVARGQKSGANYYGLVVIHWDDLAGSYDRHEVITNIPTNVCEPYFYLTNGATAANVTGTINFITLESD